MSRSSKKGPYVDEKLFKKVSKLGEFSPTRTFRGHSGKKAAMPGAPA